MAQRFPTNWIDELYSRADIVQIVSAYLPLQQKGSNYWGLCPFHNEKTPSFSVSPNQNLYYCFGCKTGGSVVNFIMEMEKLSYPEAVTFLAKQVGLPLPSNAFNHEEHVFEEKRQRIYLANEEAARYYNQLLWSEKGVHVLEYFRSRGITDGSIRKFGLGASDDSWSSLTDYLLEKGFSIDELVSAGLTIVKNKGHYDMFRNRALFPIISTQNRVIAFGGRALDDSLPKYMNTADTPVFNKRKGVFAANLLKNCRNLKRVILTEGYMDVISLTQSGVEGVVATLGTAFTAEQAIFLKRYASEIWVCYDGDGAGQKATRKAIETLKKESIPCRVIAIPDSLDPDEFIKKFSASEFNAIQPISDKEFLILNDLKDVDLNNSVERVRYVRYACEVIKGSDPVEVDYLLKLLQIKTGIDKSVLSEQLASVKKNQTPAIKETFKRPLSREEEHRPNYVNAEYTLLAMLATGAISPEFMKAEDFSVEGNRKVAELLLKGASVASIVDSMDDENQRSAYSKILSDELIPPKEKAEAAALECLSIIRIESLQHKAKKLQKDMNSLNGHERLKLLEDIGEIYMEIENLKNKRR